MYLLEFRQFRGQFGFRYEVYIQSTGRACEGESCVWWRTEVKLPEGLCFPRPDCQTKLPVGSFGCTGRVGFIYQIFVVTLNIAILLTLAVSGRQVQNELIKIVHILQSSPLLQQHQKKKMLNTSQKSTAVPKKRSLSI